MAETQFSNLFAAYYDGRASEDELRAFRELVAGGKHEDELAALVQARWEATADVGVFFTGAERDQMLEAILRSQTEAETDKNITRIHRVHFIRRFRWAAAAIFILVASTVVLFLNSDQKPTPAIAVVPHDIKAPETNKATITLPNGKQIMLDTVPNGTLIEGIARKNADGQLTFEGNASPIAYIITTNPRNSQAMRITLPDATEVWLNADTKLKYPTNYGEKERLVSLNGEADFKVKHNTATIFKVLAGDHVIEDVGTEFNVKAYSNEGGTQTTLLEGAVRINNSITSLKPGQQFANNKITTANLDEVMAWKNGSFYLEGRELGSVANEIGRWYDVEIVFKNEAAKKNIVFGGEMGRDLTINQAIRVLEKMSVHAKLEGKKLIVQ